MPMTRIRLTLKIDQIPSPITQDYHDIPIYEGTTLVEGSSDKLSDPRGQQILTIQTHFTA